jgi:SAM-dependent methyltransferase
MEQSRIWDYFQNEGADSFRGARPRLLYLAGRIPKGADVLDIGVGDGTFERIAVARGLRVHVIDPDAKSVERARTELGLGERAKIGTATALPWPDASFDAVVVSEVLEHFDDATLRGSLAEANRVLRVGGELIGTVPADEVLEQQRVVCPDCGRRFHRWGHEQSFSRDRLRSLLDESFDAAEVRRRWFVAWDQLNWKGRLQAAARLVLTLAGIWGQGHNLVFGARKRSQSS